MVCGMLLLPATVSADWLGSQAGKGNVLVCFAFNFTGLPATGEEHHVDLPYDVTFPTNLGTALGKGITGCKFKTAATADAPFLLKDNGTTKATITVSGSGTTCTLSTQAAFTISQNHRMALVAPTQDATLADGGITICGGR